MTSDPTSDFEAQRPETRSVWGIAAVGALAIHLACVGIALSRASAEDADDEMGAPAIEVGLEFLAPRAPPSDLPPGPDAEASAASPSVMEQKQAVEQTDLPKALPTETDDPDRVVSPNDSQKPKDDDPKVAAVQAAASTESVASEATAMPSAQTAQDSTRSVAPAQGSGESARRVRTTWQKQLIAHLDRHKRYPGDRHQQAAEILVSFEIDRTGHVLSTRVVRGSGDASFDEAALAMVRRSDPVPMPPALVADEGLTFTLPVVFRVKAKH